VNQFAYQDRFTLPFSWRAWNKTPKKCWIYENWVFIPTRVGIVFVKTGIFIICNYENLYIYLWLVARDILFNMGLEFK